jgi:Mn2+/Fe2+ NRAMP family transporter
MAAFLYETRHGHPVASHVAAGLVPRFRGPDSVLLASGFVGATVMPHVIYLHSALTQEALAVLGLGGDPTQALVISQVVLSFCIPFALVPLILLTRRADLMGGWVNRRRSNAAAI